MRTLLPLVLTLAACSTEAPPPAPVVAAAPAVSVDAAKLALFAPLPARMDVGGIAPTPEQIALGRALYYDARLSKNQDISCNSCHGLGTFGVDNLPTSPGHKGQLGGRNSPTTMNAAGHVAQFWDGRAADVEAQAKGPVLNPVEMAMPDEGYVLRVLASIPGYAPMFASAFPDEPAITYDAFGRAVGAFERGLTTPSRWDRFLEGDTAALTDPEKLGFETFVDAGCVACHTGAYVGGDSYRKLGQIHAWPDETSDLGRVVVTGQASDTMLFKVPSLRNITKTAPYFHDGKVATLEEAVKKMGHHQLGQELTDEQVASIVTWLGSLEGAVNADYIAKPTLPESGPTTPKPDPS